MKHWHKHCTPDELAVITLSENWLNAYALNSKRHRRIIRKIYERVKQTTAFKKGIRDANT
jgi:hypothetical protein